MKVLEYIAAGVLVVAGLVVVFVKAGQGGGQSGGAQASQIINSAGKNSASFISALEGGPA
jgi:hypothetical protein